MTDQELYRMLSKVIFTSLGESDLPTEPESVLAVGRALAKIACNMPIIIGISREQLILAVLSGIQESNLGGICKMAVVRLKENGGNVRAEDNLEIN